MSLAHRSAWVWARARFLWRTVPYSVESPLSPEEATRRLAAVLNAPQRSLVGLVSSSQIEGRCADGSLRATYARAGATNARSRGVVAHLSATASGCSLVGSVTQATPATAIPLVVVAMSAVFVLLVAGSIVIDVFTRGGSVSSGLIFVVGLLVVPTGALAQLIVTYVNVRNDWFLLDRLVRHTMSAAPSIELDATYGIGDATLENVEMRERLLASPWRVARGAARIITAKDFSRTSPLGVDVVLARLQSLIGRDESALEWGPTVGNPLRGRVAGDAIRVTYLNGPLGVMGRRGMRRCELIALVEDVAGSSRVSGSVRTIGRSAAWGPGIAVVAITIVLTALLHRHLGMVLTSVIDASAVVGGALTARRAGIAEAKRADEQWDQVVIRIERALDVGGSASAGG